MTIQKNPDTKKEPLPEQSRHKGKRNRKPTACMDKRRGYRTCGICGSENLASHGVSWCNQCKEEIYFFILDGGWGASEKIPNPGCKCDTHKHPYYPCFPNISVGVCLDCGAVKGPRCPVCKSKMWVKDNKKYCKGYCGYKI
jgi:hypothetical protein